MSKAPDVPERALLDTSVVIAGDVAPIPGVVAISAITLAELQFGVLVAKTAPVRAERLRRQSGVNACLASRSFARTVAHARQ